MEAFSELLEQLYFTGSNNAKAALIMEYLRTTPDPDRGWAIAAIAGTLRFDFFKRNAVKQLALERVDPVLFELSYDYVGEMSETVAHLWSSPSEVPPQPLPCLSEVVTRFRQAKREDIKGLLAGYLDRMTAPQRWALIKLGTRSLRIGVSARSIKQILARYADIPVAEIEAIWHGVEPPYQQLLAWLEGNGTKPDISDQITFHPVMLSHPIEEKLLDSLDIQQWQIEYKYDGIRVQLVHTSNGKALFSRTGDDISHAFPDLLEAVEDNVVLDGELLVFQPTGVDTFNALQQRLNKKKPTAKLMKSYPAGLMVYDALKIGDRSLVELPLAQRYEQVKEWLTSYAGSRLRLSPTLQVDSVENLKSLHRQASEDRAVEGLMLKQKDSLYVPGRPKGQWFKWKRDPKHVDAVLMYAQRGHGKRSSFYSDFTFGAWDQEVLLPIGKAYSGFTDEELKKLDNWVRRNTIKRFGPVREVEKTLVVEIAFDAVQNSTRHKSGVALRFPRFFRIRWDKPASEADHLDTVRQLIDA